MSEAELNANRGAPVVPTNEWIIVARHVVGIGLVLLIRPLADNFAILWAGAVAVVLLGASVIAGLWWLFFTSSSRGKVLRNFANAGWALAILLTLGLWSGTTVGQVLGAIVLIALFIGGVAQVVNKVAAKHGDTK